KGHGGPIAGGSAAGLLFAEVWVFFPVVRRSMPLATHTRIPSRPWPTLCLLAGLLCTASLPAAQVDLEPPDALTAGDVIGEVVTALQEGDSDALLHRATRRVEIVLLGQSARYSRGQAALVLA